MKIERIELLNVLESVMPGISKRDIVEQSSCFVFQGGRVSTFNDEIACSLSSPLNIEGAVQAEPFLAILRKLAEEQLSVKLGDGELRFKGKRRQGGVRMEADVVLPIDDVDAPTEEGWKPLAPKFSEGVMLVEKCAGKEADSFSTTCVHIHPKHVEAYDNLQIARFKMRTGVEKPILVRASSLKHIHPLGMTEICETGSWLHFRNPTGLVLSCRRHQLDEVDPGALLDVGSLLKVTGEPTVLPKGLVEAAEKAEVFSAENSEGNHVSIDLKAGKLRVTGRGVSGWYQETKAVQYEGGDLSFMIDPQLLTEITKQHNKCEITKDRLKVKGGSFTYVTCLGVVEAGE